MLSVILMEIRTGIISTTVVSKEGRNCSRILFYLRKIENYLSKIGNYLSRIGNYLSKIKMQ